MTTEWQRSVLDPVEGLIGRWEERGETEAVAALLPAWRANSGLTDGWQDVLAAMRAVSQRVTLPGDEAETLASAADQIASALRNR